MLYTISVTFPDVEAESPEDAASRFAPIMADIMGGFGDGALAVAVLPEGYGTSATQYIEVDARPRCAYCGAILTPGVDRACDEQGGDPTGTWVCSEGATR